MSRFSVDPKTRDRVTFAALLVVVGCAIVATYVPSLGTLCLVIAGGAGAASFAIRLADDRGSSDHADGSSEDGLAVFKASQLYADIVAETPSGETLAFETMFPHSCKVYTGFLWNQRRSLDPSGRVILTLNADYERWEEKHLLASWVVAADEVRSMIEEDVPLLGYDRADDLWEAIQSVESHPRSTADYAGIPIRGKRKRFTS